MLKLVKDPLGQSKNLGEVTKLVLSGRGEEAKSRLKESMTSEEQAALDKVCSSIEATRNRLRGEVLTEGQFPEKSLLWQHESLPPGTGWSKADGFYSKTVKQNSKLWNCLLSCFQLLGKDDLNILGITAVCNSQQVKDFNSYVAKIEGRRKESPVLFNRQDWMFSAQSEDHTLVFNKFQEACLRFIWNIEEGKPMVIPVFHGTGRETAEKICKHGFAALASLDAGYFGQGMYFSSHICYTTPYIASQHNPCIVMSFAYPGNVYPVIEDMNGPNSLLGTPAKAGYNTHYVTTNIMGKVQLPIEGVHNFDEVVLFQESQVFPAFILDIDPSNLREVVDKWKRDIVTTSTTTTSP